MNLVPVDICPVTQRTGSLKHVSVLDFSFGVDGLWTLFADPLTGHLWLNPRPSDNDTSALYASYYTHDGHEKHTGLWQSVLALGLAQHLGYPRPANLPPLVRLLARMPTVPGAAKMEMLKIPASTTGRLLDFGCGDGSLMHRFHNAGWQVWGIEPDAQAVARLRQRFGFDVRSSPAQCTDLAAHIHVIAMSHLIEHLADPVATLAACRPLLTPGGRVVIVTPNANSIGHRLFGRYWRGLEAPRHMHIFTTGSLRMAVERAGFRVVQMSTETRMARGIFTVSLLAFLGKRKIEVQPRFGRAEKLLGYAFHMIEGLLHAIFPMLGEELYCVAEVRTG